MITIWIGRHRPKRNTVVLSLRSCKGTLANAYCVWSRSYVCVCVCACHQLSAAASLTSYRSPYCQRVSTRRQTHMCMRWHDDRVRQRTFTRVRCARSTQPVSRPRHDITLQRLSVLPLYRFSLIWFRIWSFGG